MNSRCAAEIGRLKPRASAPRLVAIEQKLIETGEVAAAAVEPHGPVTAEVREAIGRCMSHLDEFYALEVTKAGGTDGFKNYHTLLQESAKDLPGHLQSYLLENLQSPDLIPQARRLPGV